MYRALWNVLPGNLWLKVVQMTGLALVVVAVLFLVVFPFIADTFLVEGSTVG